MQILADKDIPYVRNIFQNNYVQLQEGRSICLHNIRNINALIIRSITQVNRFLLENSSVQFVGTVTSGLDHIDQTYLKEVGISLASAPGSNAIAVVEYVMSALFWLARRDGFFLRDRVVGIVGVGHVGSILSQRLKSLGISVLLCDPFLSITNSKETWKSLDKLISESDVLTLHTPLVYDGKYPTWHMIDFDVLNELSNYSILINTSRGPVVDNMALLKILEKGKKLRVVLDVWETEPKLSLPLLSYVDIGTAHIAGYTIESKMRGILKIYNEYCKFFKIFNIFKKSKLLSLSCRDCYVDNILDEFLLCQLIMSVYNISIDDFYLKKMAKISGGFDRLRKSSVHRREWKSLRIKTHRDSDLQVINDIGFSFYQ